MAQARLLVVDDDPAILAALKPVLERAGFDAIGAADGEQALARVQDAHPDLIILDLGLPGMSGREVLRRLRRAGDWTAVVVLTSARGEVVPVLTEGADDYISKPFDPPELIARARAVLHRTGPSLAGALCLVSGDLRLNRQARRVALGGQTLNLSPRAVDVLKYLMLHAGEAVARERLLEDVWGLCTEAATRAVDVRVAELRKALNDDPGHPHFIETVTDVGYRFSAPVEGKPCAGPDATF